MRFRLFTKTGLGYAPLGTIVLWILTTFVCPAGAAGTHQWSEEELRLLSSFMLRDTQAANDASNRVSGNNAAINLGHKLFFDTRLSGNGKVSCASCHQPDRHFSDGLATGQGIATVHRNTPTVVGAAGQAWYFHDGRADSLWAQALGPLENEREHGGNRGQYAQILFNDTSLRADYEKVFGPVPDISDTKRFPLSAGPVADPAANNAWRIMRESDRKVVTDIFVNLGKAIAAYEAQLMPSASRFDRYVQAALGKSDSGMRELLSTDEVQGLRLFIGKGRCLTCHSGPMFRDGAFHGVAIPPPEGKAYDWGRYNGAREVLKSPFNCRSEYNDVGSRDCPELDYIITDKHETLGAMKTPGLRDVTRTAPYMHAGQYQTLAEVLKHYADPPTLEFRQSDLFMNIDLDENERAHLEAFLGSLASETVARTELWRAPR